jgi:Fic family protein
VGKVVRRTWRSSIESGLPRRDRRSCGYEAYIPDPLVGGHLTIDADVAADIADAEAAIIELNARHGVLAATEALARLLLRAEAVASSRIEGLEVSPRRLLRAEAARQLGDHARDVTATEVLGNLESMAWATGEAANGRPITRQFILETHERLLTHTDRLGIAGNLREVQNWIGGSSYNPCSATFVPPPPEFVPDLLDDLVAFLNDDLQSPLTQAAIAHAQFETIHPFADGNGRTGRALIHVVLRRRGLAPRVVPPISLVLATRSKDYIYGLNRVRYSGAPTSKAAHDGLNEWLAIFASACTRAVEHVTIFEARIESLRDAWEQRLGRVRADSAAERVLTALPGAPILTVTTTAALIRRSYQQTNHAMQRLTDAGVLKQISVGQRNRAFEAAELIDAFTDLERQLASPAGDTRSERPNRPAPARPARRTS